jgi:hypothetical protein
VTTPNAISLSIRDITLALVEHGLADDQNMPFWSDTDDGSAQVRYRSGLPFSAWLKDQPYAEMYALVLESRDYNFRLLDGAMVQMHYEFRGGAISRHRLAFLPSPTLLEFQNNPDLYLEEHLYAEVVEKRVVTVPLRFDYDGRPEVFQALHHPRCHLTLGQYSRCRIPVSAPVPPHLFADFILRNFYNTAFRSASDLINAPHHVFAECIDPVERSVLHLAVAT